MVWATETGERGTARSARMMLLSSLVVVVQTERYARRTSSLLLSLPVMVERLK